MADQLASPHELMSAIDADARSLDAGGRELAKAITRLADREKTYTIAFEQALIEIFHAAKEHGERMPAEDIRKALAHRKVPPEVYGAFLGERAKVDGLKAWTRTLESALSARQSLLNALKAELRAS